MNFATSSPVLECTFHKQQNHLIQDFTSLHQVGDIKLSSDGQEAGRLVFSAFPPLIRMTAIADRPGGEATAYIVSFALLLIFF